MTKPLADDILYAISCVQDYRDTINTDNVVGQQVYDDVGEKIERLFKFYYQLIGI